MDELYNWKPDPKQAEASSRYLNAAFDAEPPAPPQRGIAGDMASGLKRGLFVGVPQMAGGAMKAFSPVDSRSYRAGQELQDSARAISGLPEVQRSETEHGIIGDTLVAGAEGLGQMAPVIAGSLINPLLGAGIAGGMYGGSSYQDTKERMLEQEGLDDAHAAAHPDDPRIAKARRTGLATGVVQGVGDAAMSYLGGRFLKGAFPAFGNQTAQGVVRGIASPGKETLKRFGTAWGAEMVGEGVTEAAQDEGQAAIERAAGLKDAPAFGEQALESARGGVGMAMLLGPLAGPGHYRMFRDARQVEQALRDPAVKPEVRSAAARIMGDSIATVDQSAAANFLDHAHDAIGGEEQTGSAPYGLNLDDTTLLSPFVRASNHGSSSDDSVRTPPAESAAPPGAFVARQQGTVGSDQGTADGGQRTGGSDQGTVAMQTSAPPGPVPGGQESPFLVTSFRPESGVTDDDIPDFPWPGPASLQPIATPDFAPPVPRGPLSRALARVLPDDSLPEARPVTSPVALRGIAGPVVDAEYSEVFPALPAPPGELEKARAWARAEIAAGRGLGLMQGYGTSEEQHAANILTRYRRALEAGTEDEGRGTGTAGSDQRIVNSGQQPVPGPQSPVPDSPIPSPKSPVPGQGARRRQLDPTRDDLVVAMARLGGLDLSQAKEQWGTTVGDDAKALNRHAGRAGGTGIAYAFKSGGLPLDRMREALVEHGYLPEGATINDLAEAVHAAARGNHTYSSQADVERRLDQAEQEWLSRQDLSQALELTDEELAASGFDDLMPEEQQIVDGVWNDIETVLSDLFDETDHVSFTAVHHAIQGVRNEIRLALTDFPDAEAVGAEGETTAGGPAAEGAGGGGQAGGAQGRETGTGDRGAVTGGQGTADREQEPVPEHVVNAVKSPRDVPQSVSLATKQQTKDTLNTFLSSGSLSPQSPIRLTTVEELHDIITNGTLRPGNDFEGRSGISAQLVDGKKPIVAYGPNDRISAAIVFPEYAAVGKGVAPNEVKIDSRTEVAELRFVVDGFRELMTFDQLKEAVGEKQGTAGSEQGTESSDQEKTLSLTPDASPAAASRRRHHLERMLANARTERGRENWRKRLEELKAGQKTQREAQAPPTNGHRLFTPAQLAEFEKYNIDVSKVTAQYKNEALQHLEFQKEQAEKLASPDYNTNLQAEYDRIAQEQAIVHRTGSGVVRKVGKKFETERNDGSKGSHANLDDAKRTLVGDPQSRQESAATEFVKTPDGGIDFGSITPEMGRAMQREAAPLRLRTGNEQEGLRHIEERHGKDIRALGYDDVIEFVQDIASNFSAIHQAGAGVLDLVVTSGKLKFARVKLELSEDGSYYDIKTATPGRNDQYKNKKPLWENAGPSVSSGQDRTPLIPGEKAASGTSISTTDVEVKQSSAAATKPRSASPKVTDSGEELTYNKRNRIRTGISWNDVAGKNDALKAKEVQKGNVYPKPDYEALVTDGMRPEIAHIVKQVYDALAAKPSVRGVPTDADFQLYITAVKRVMDGVMAWSNDRDAIRSFVERNARVAGAMLGKRTALGDLAPGRSLLDIVYPDGWRAHKDEVRIMGGNKALGALQPGTDELVRALKDIDKGWPGKIESWRRQGWRIVDRDDFSLHDVPQRGDSPTIYVIRLGREHITTADTREKAQAYLDELKQFVLLDKRRTVTGSFETEAQAREAAREAVKKTGGDNRIEERGMNVADAERTGPAHRMEGEDVGSDQLRDTFGFRGVNFGNWVPQDERQLHLNHAYDSFMDLAEIMEVPPKALSLNGMLGLAIGAQGGGNFAAHFVPGVNEINITRTAGAGSLAHEWAHALDHYFATMAGYGAAPAPWLSVLGKNKEGGEARPEVLKAFGGIVSAMEQRKQTPEEATEAGRQRREQARQRLEKWLDYIGAQFKGNEEAAEGYAALADRIRRGDYQLGEEAYVQISPARTRGGGTAVLSVVSDVRDLAKKSGVRISLDDIKALHQAVSSAKYLDEKQQGGHEPQLVMTAYRKAALKLDRDKKKEYWSTKPEMFARAFDAYVTDKLEEKAQANSYLSHTGREGDTVPTGEERTVIDRAFDTLIANLETRETEQGVALYSTAQPATVTPAATIRTALESALKLSRIPIHVIQRLSDLPAHIQADMRLFGIEAIDGVFDPASETMYLVADYIPSVERARELLRHEWFHAGVVDKELEALYRYYSRKDLARLQEIADERGFDLSTRSGQLEAAGELAAQLAETNPRNLFLARIVARIKEWLRALGLQVEFGRAEVAGIIRDAIQRVQANGEHAQGARALAGSAYSAPYPPGQEPRFGKTGNNANDYITVNGSADLWNVPAEVARRTGGRFPEAPVRLLVGRHFGAHRGFGVAHINAEHSADLAKIGMTAEQYVFSILSRASSIRDAGDQKVLYVFAEGMPRGVAALELRLHDGGYYSVRTAFDMKAVGKVVWSGRTASPGVVQNRVPGISRQSLPKDIPTASSSAKESSHAAHRPETEVSPKPTLEGLEDQTLDNTARSDRKVNPQYSTIGHDQFIAAHARAINAPAKVADMIKGLFELIGQNVPERLKANIGKVLSNPWFGSEGKPIRRKVVNLNIERSRNRTGIISDLFQASEGYTGVEGLDNILKGATKEERRQFNELIKYGDRNDVARTFTRDELYRGKTPFGKLSRTVVEAYKAFIEIMQAANRVRFQQLDELSLLPYQDQPWFDALVELLNRNQERTADMSREEAGDFHRLVRSLKRGLTDEQLKDGDNPAKVHATDKVIAAYRDFWAQVEQVEKRHQGMMLSAFRDILGYRGELDKLKNEWGSLKGYAPRNRKDGDWHVSVYTTNDEGERVKVYMKPTLTEAGARRHVAEVKAHLEKYLKSTFDPDAEYQVEYERNQATPPELLAWKGSEVAVEALLNQAFDRAGMTGKMSAEEWHSLKHEVFQEIAKQIMAQGFGRHGIAREKQFIEGYEDTDYQVVLKEYISGMAGWLSKMRFAIETTSAAKEISKADPQDKVWVNDYVQDAMKNGTYMDELAATARSVGAVWYLGFKVSSAILNGFQNYTVGQAELSRIMKQEGIGKSAVAFLAKAQKDVLRDFANRTRGGAGTLSEEERDVLRRAVREGTAQAQAVRMMSGSQEMGFGQAWKKVTEYSMTPFAFVEQHINREPAILAAYRAFKTTAAGEFDAAAYRRAEEFVNSTHYVMGRENLPEIVRTLGPLGKTVYLFQGYVHNYLHWLYNRARLGEFETIARSLGAIAALGGVFALPGADDLGKWITRWFGVSYKLKFKAWMRRHAREYGTPGEALEAFVNHGATSVFGVDMSRALAVNIPFVADPDQTFGERVGGVWGGLLQKPGMAMNAAHKGDYLRALESILPEFAANPLRAARQYGRGATTLSGKPILDEDGHQMSYGGMDVAKKVLGFQPLEVSERTGMKSAERGLSAVWNDERNDKLAALRVASSREQVRTAIQDIIRWNRSLQQSQARGLVTPISSTSIQRARRFKPTKTDRNRMQWERGYVS